MDTAKTTANEAGNKPADSGRRGIYKPQARSRVTNGHELLPDVDHRTIWVRRFRDVNALHLNDLGGEEACSEAEKALTRRAACLIVELEALEQTFAQQGGAETSQLENYQRATNTLRRVLESLSPNLQRRAKDVTGPSLGALLRQDLDRSREAQR
jgi:hypothetical protein